MQRPFAPACARRRGAALLEFALVMPLLLIVGLLLIQYGIIMNATNVLTNTSREGARYAALNAFKDKQLGYANTKGYIETVADQTSVKYASLTDVTITTPNGVKSGEPIQVAVTYNMGRKLFLPANLWFVSVYNKPYTAHTTMIIQQGKDAANNQDFPTPTATNTSPPPTPTNTPTPLPTATPYPPNYKTPTPVPTSTPTPIPTSTPTPRGGIPTSTPQPTPTPTSNVPTPTPKPTNTPEPTNTPKPTPTRRPS